MMYNENISLIYKTMYNKIFVVIIYKRIYDDNKYFIIHENVFSLYKTMYNYNI